VIARPRREIAMAPGAVRTDSGDGIRLWRTLPLVAFGAAVALVTAPMIDPTAAFALNEQVQLEEDYGIPIGQSLIAFGSSTDDIDRDGFTVTQEVIEKAEKEAEVTLPPAGKPDPGTAKEIAYDLVVARGWNEKQYTCLVALWNRESHWNVNAHNKGSGAHGIPQALPGKKMASAGPDWATNPRTQIKWGLGYISGRYGTPCAAWASSERRGWY
jgi:hypothetical protein